VKEAEITRTAPTYGNIRHGFAYERALHITLKFITNNAEIDLIWDSFQQVF
jgi:adenine-specific DNA-methyltransferase